MNAKAARHGMSVDRRAAASLIAGLLASGFASAQPYPVKQITIIVPLAAGSPPDAIARALGQQLTPVLGQPILVVPRGGAGGTIGGQVVAKSKPDGYTLLMGSITSLAIAPTVYHQSGFNAAKAFLAVGQVYSSPSVLVTGGDFPAATLKEFIAVVKDKPGQFNVTSPATGSLPHMAAEMFKAAAGVDMVHVPFGTNALATNALLSRQAHLTIAGAGPMLGQIRSGGLRVLATAARSRLSALPDVPTTAEAGLPDLLVDAWGGLVAPLGTPQAVVRQLNAAVQKALVEKELREVLTRLGAEPAGGAPEEFGRMIVEDEVRWARAVKAAGVKAD
jgi:tripartite-type tricarboxylate transporter receptor subunit TctC